MYTTLCLDFRCKKACGQCPVCFDMQTHLDIVWFDSQSNQAHQVPVCLNEIHERAYTELAFSNAKTQTQHKKWSSFAEEWVCLRQRSVCFVSFVRGFLGGPWGAVGYGFCLGLFIFLHFASQSPSQASSPMFALAVCSHGLQIGLRLFVFQFSPGIGWPEVRAQRFQEV